MMYPVIPRGTAREQVPHAMRRIIERLIAQGGGVANISGQWKRSPQVHAAIQRISAAVGKDAFKAADKALEAGGASSSADISEECSAVPNNVPNLTEAGGTSTKKRPESEVEVGGMRTKKAKDQRRIQPTWDVEEGDNQLGSAR